MVGKPNFPPDVDARKDLKGAARPIPGLPALDRAREASMADEGGAAAAAVEAEAGSRDVRDGDLTEDDEDDEGEDEYDESPLARPLVATFLFAGAVSALAFLIVRKLVR